MNKRVLSIFLLVFVSGLAGCGSEATDPSTQGLGDPHEQAMQQLIETQSAMVDTLKGIKDKQTAEAAADEFVKLVNQMQEQADALASLEDPSEEQADALKSKYQAQMEQANKAMAQEVVRIMKLDPETQHVLSHSLNLYERKAKEAKQTIRFKYKIF